MNYAKALERTMADEAKPGKYSAMTADQLKKGIAEISEALKGSMPNSERIIQAAARHGMREELTRRAPV